MKHFFDGDHAFRPVAIKRKKKRRHFPLPALVYVPPLHFGERLLEVRSFQVSYQQPVRTEEQGIVALAGFTQRLDHLRPHLAMPRFILFQLFGPDV